MAHLPDVINPDQPPFWSFAGADSFLGYEATIDILDALDWDYLSGGHGNVGSRDDIAFYRTFLTDLKAAVRDALGSTPWGAGVNDPAALNAHTAYLPAWLGSIGTKVTDTLRPKYGDYYGFEYATPRNAEMVELVFFFYR